MFCLIVEVLVYGKLVRSCWNGLSVGLTTLFLDRLTFLEVVLKAVLSSQSDMLTNQQFRENSCRNS